MRAMSSSPANPWARYFERNPVTEDVLERRRRMWGALLPRIRVKPRTVLEVGGGLGENLRALDAYLIADAHNCDPFVDADIPGMAQRIETDQKFDLVFTCGCLIHVPPAEIEDACKELARVSGRHVLMIEYFAPKHQEIVWHGQRDVLWKGDFGSDFMDANPEWRPVDHGFFWRPVTGLDNLNWWLFER